MKQHIQSLLEQSVSKLQSVNQLPQDIPIDIQIDRTRDPQFGDFSSNLAFKLAKSAKINPRELAKQLLEQLPSSTQIQKVEIAGPGFLNFWIADDAFQQTIIEILKSGKQFGLANLGHGKKIYLEYVSANPTGPLHVGHGRAAVYADCVARILTATGYQVHREYYVNDAGRQMKILALSIWIRYLQAQGEPITLPAKAYKGQYIIHIAKALAKEHGARFHKKTDEITRSLPKEPHPDEDKKAHEAYIDAFIEVATTLLGETDFSIIRQTGIKSILNDIKDDLAEFGVTYDQWFHESQLISSGLLNEGLNLLKEHGYTTEKEGALWFNAIDLGDEKDRVLIRKNGQPTYFASDVAYHLYKYNQGVDQVIDVFGADHHGYISRIRAFLKGLGKDPEKLKILLIQFAVLYRGKEKIAMSTREGESSYVTLRELRYEVGNDAARYFYIMRKPEQHLDFDLDLAKSQSADNPVYYIQYAHARICSVWNQLETLDWDFDQQQGIKNLNQLDTTHEKNLMNALSRYPEVIEAASANYEPHVLTHYLHEFANLFHSYYNASKFLVEQSELRNARLCLIAATQQVLANGLKLLGLSTPKKM